MDGRIVLFVCFFSGLVMGEYSERGSGATSFAQVFNRLYETSDRPQYRSIGGDASFPKEIPVAFPVAVEKKVPVPFKVPVAQVPYAVERPYPVKVYQPAIPIQQNIGKSPFQQLQPFHHQDGFNQPYHQHHQ